VFAGLETRSGDSMANPSEIGKAFVDHYYKTFDTNRSSLGSLYQDQSYLTFEGGESQGAQNIVAKLVALPFQKCQHHISSVDTQPSLSGGIMVFVTGQLMTEGEANALKFSQIFHLAPAAGSYVVSNDMFRLNYG